MEIKRLLWKEKTSLIKEYIFYVQLNKKEIKDIALFTWMKLVTTRLLCGSAGTNCSSTHLLNMTEFTSR
jgi:hypothetical protein